MECESCWVTVHDLPHEELFDTVEIAEEMLFLEVDGHMYCLGCAGNYE